MQQKTIRAGCPCQSNHLILMNEPIIRFICHCLVCQKYTGKAYSDVSIFMQKDVQNLQIQNTKFKRYKLPPNIRRGICLNCQQPSVELGVLGQLVLLPTMNILDQQFLPAPRMHLFYHRRVADIHDDLPKYEGMVSSQLMMSLHLAKGIFQKIQS